MLEDSVRKNAENEIDLKVKSHMARHGVDYRTAFLTVTRRSPELAKRYAFGGDAAVEKRYNADSLSPAKQQLNALVADSAKTRFLAGSVLDHLAKQKMTNIGSGPFGAPTYKQALVQCRKENPSLAEAADSGYIASGDWALLGLLIPAVAKEVEQGNYSESGRCPSCGEHKAYCRGKKLARKRGVDEDNVKAFSQCILDARKYGDSLDEIRCFYR